VLLQLGDNDEAIAEYQSAIANQPNYYEAHLGLGRLLLSRGDRSSAEPHLRKASESPDVEIRREASVLLSQRVPK
jgi:tetratricopeptide (TPR) repeat protein